MHYTWAYTRESRPDTWPRPTRRSPRRYTRNLCIIPGNIPENLVLTLGYVPPGILHVAVQVTLASNAEKTLIADFH